MNRCVRRKFLNRLGKRVLWIVGGIATAIGVLAFLLIINRDGWMNKIIEAIAPFCLGGILILILIGGILAAKDWCKDTLRECRWECKAEDE